MNNLQAARSGMRLADIPELTEHSRVSNYELVIPGLENITRIDNPDVVLNNAVEIIRMAVRASSVPSFNVNTLTTTVGNHTIKYAGKPDFSGLDLTFDDYVDAHVYEILESWKNKAYNPATQKIGRARDYKMIAYLHQYDSTHETLMRTWELLGAWCPQVTLGGFNDENDAKMQITGQIVFDNYKLLTEN